MIPGWKGCLGVVFISIFCFVTSSWDVTDLTCKHGGRLWCHGTKAKSGLAWIENWPKYSKSGGFSLEPSQTASCPSLWPIVRSATNTMELGHPPPRWVDQIFPTKPVEPFQCWPEWCLDNPESGPASHLLVWWYLLPTQPSERCRWAYWCPWCPHLPGFCFASLPKVPDEVVRMFLEEDDVLRALGTLEEGNVPLR